MIGRGVSSLLLAGGLLLAACSGVNPGVNPGANPQQRVSPLPPGYRPLSARPLEAPGGGSPGGGAAEDTGVALDEVLAVVEGEVITRRRLAREAGGQAPGEDEAAFERALRRRLLQRARLLLFVKEAQRVGVTLSEQRLDEVVQEELDARVKEATETVGRQVSVEEYLREEGLTVPAFREQVREELFYQAYILRLLRGLGGPTRPMVDLDVTPAEVRRVYWENPGAFDEKRSVHFVVWQVAFQRYMEGDAGFLEAEAAAGRDAQALAQAFHGGGDPAEVASRFGIEEGSWKDSGDLVPDTGLVRLLGEENTSWLFDPARQPRDTVIRETPQGPLVLGVLATKPGRRIPYEEAYDKVSEAIRRARILRLENETVIEILTTRNVVQPQAVADALLDQAREVLDQLGQDPVLGRARMR